MEQKSTPQNLEAEAVVLGSLLLDNSIAQRVLEILPNKNYFYHPNHQKIFGSILELLDAGEPAEMTSVSDKLRGQVESTYLATVIEHVVSPANVTYYAKQIKESFIRRKVIQVATQIVHEGYETKNGSDSRFVEKSIESLWGVIQEGGRQVKVISPGELWQRRREGLNQRDKRDNILTGYPPIDRFMTFGFAPGMLSIIAGRPSMGKSALKVNLTSSLCSRGHGVISFALEGGFDSEMDRLDSLRTSIPVTDLILSRNWQKDDPRIEQVRASGEFVSENWNLHYVPTRGITVADVRRSIRYVLRKWPIDVVFIDLFDKLKDVNVSMNKPSIVTQKLGEILDIAEELKVHFCLLVQIRRSVEARRDHRPMLQDLKDSGGYEEAADLVYLLYREKYYNQDSDSDQIEINIAKQRHGIAGVRVSLDFDLETLGVSTPLDWES